MKPNSFFTLLTFLFVIIEQIAFTQANSTDKQTSHIYYAYSGLGSNMGSFQPTLEINGTKFNYTYEQNSYWKERSKKIDKISSDSFRQSSVDSILDLVKNMKDTLISRVNPCILSGGIHYLTILNGTDTTRFELHNTFDYTAIKIITIINQYLPTDKKLWGSKELIKSEEDCFANMRKELEKKKQSN